LGKTLVGGDDGECGRHWAPPFSSSFTLSAPVLTVRAGSKVWRIDSGQAAYLRSGTLKLTSTYSAGSSPAALMRSTRAASCAWSQDRKSTRLNSNHVKISYAAFR